MATTPETIHCEVCNITLSKKISDSHFNGKKHIARKNEHDRLLNSVFVSGVENVPRSAMRKIFNRFGPVESISDYAGKKFCFVKYSNRESPEKAIKARVFYNNRRLFIRSVKPQNKDQNAGPRNVHQEQEDLDVEISSISVQSDGVKSVFELQVEQLISRIQLGEDEYRKHLEICNDLEDTFKFLGARAVIFGSCGNTLAMKNSDIDIYLDCTTGQPEETFVSKDCKVMYKSKLYSHIIRIGKARVPIVRFIHSKTGIRCDVTVKNKLGVMNSKLIKFLVSLDHRIRPFIMFLKYWAKEYSITANSRLSSYALVMMAIFYLQQLEPPLLPPISKLTTSDDMQGGWCCGFIDNAWIVSLEKNDIFLKDIVKGFFDFYSKFEYNKFVICPLLGQPILVDDLETPERLPDAFESYKNYIKDNQDYAFKVNFPLRIQDPFELNYNLGRGFTDKHLKMLCDICFQSYVIFKENENENELLSTLMSLSKKPRSIKQNEKTFHIPWSVQGSDEKCVKRQPPAATSEVVNEWYTLVKKAVLMVFKYILKVNMEESDDILNKIKKISDQNDVHTSKKSVFHCTGNTVVFANRKKLKKRLSLCKLGEFEKDVRVSNSRQCCQDDRSKSLAFIASISLNSPSANEIPYVLLTLQDCNMDKGNAFTALMNFLQSSFETFVDHAITHIRLKRKTSAFVELTDFLYCDCVGCKTLDQNQTVKPENKNNCDSGTSGIQLNEKTEVARKVSDDEIMKLAVNTDAEVANKRAKYFVNIANPFLVAIERPMPNDSTETNLSSTDYNELDNGSSNDNKIDYVDKLDNSKTNYNKNGTLSKTDDEKTDIDSKIVNSRKTVNPRSQIGDGMSQTKRNVLENENFVIQKERNNISHSVQKVQVIVTASSNRQTYELKNTENTSSSTANISLSKSKNTDTKESESLTGNMNHKMAGYKTNINQTKINHALCFMSMRAEYNLSKINLEIKPPTKNTVTVEDIKLYVKERFRCENVDEAFLLALTKITNDIINNSNKS